MDARADDTVADAVDYPHMSRALALARRGLYTTDPNPRVGCVLVKDGRVIGEGWHVRAGEDHAEVMALKRAGSAARGSTAYVTLEPCCHFGRTPPCTSALLAAGVNRVVAAMEDPHPRVAGRGCAQLRDAGVEVSVGVLSRQARELNPGFIYRMRLQRPFVRCKLAMSLDGRTAMASGESKWITGEAARLDVHRLRARSSAIMTGVGTVLADDPSLNVRLPGATYRQPWRIILDPELKMPAEARTLGLAGTVLVFTARQDPSSRGPLEAAGAQVHCVPRDTMGLDLQAVLAELARREVNEVHLECGATLAGAMCRAGLVDELIIYMAPMLLGDSARGLVRLPGLSRMSEALRLVITDLRALGRDWRITARLASAPDLLKSTGSCDK